jgi:hypothetical protein
LKIKKTRGENAAKRGVRGGKLVKTKEKMESRNWKLRRPKKRTDPSHPP